MTTIAVDQIGLRDAADVFGVSIDTLRRRIRDNQMDEALLVQGPFGATWVLPRAEIGAIAEREGWSLDEMDGLEESEAAPSAPSKPAVLMDGGEIAADTTHSSEEADAGEQDPVAVEDGPGDPADAPPSGPDIQAPPQPSAPEAPSTLAQRVGGPLIDLREVAPRWEDQQSASASSDGIRRAGGSTAVAPPLQGVRAVGAEVALVQQIQSAIAGEVRTALSENVEAELTRVREAITSAEVRAVAAEARTDAMRSEQGRLAAQLKRAEADAEYWRSQHDRLDRELDRERTGRVTAEKARAVADTRSGELSRAGDQLRDDLTTSRDRERDLVQSGAQAKAQLDQARMAMGWWSRRRLQRLAQRSDGGGGAELGKGD